MENFFKKVEELGYDIKKFLAKVEGDTVEIERYKEDCILLQTGVFDLTGDSNFKTTVHEIHTGRPNETSECGRIIESLGQKIPLSKENYDLITCPQCKESAENILGFEEFEQAG